MQSKMDTRVQAQDDAIVDLHEGQLTIENNVRMMMENFSTFDPRHDQRSSTQ